MSQISRPFQLAVLVVGVLALAWLFVLQGHSSTNTPATSSPVVSAAAPAAPATPAAAAAAPAGAGTTAATEAQQAAAPTAVYHGAAPGVEGLSRAIAEAHGAVATSQGYSNKIEQKSAQASDQPAPATPATAPSKPTAATSAPTTSASPTTRTATPVSVSPSVSGAAKPVAKHSPTSSRPSVATGISKGSAHTVIAPRTSAQVHSKAHALPTTVAKASPQTSSSTPAGIPAGQQIVEGELKAGDVVLLYFFTPNSPSDVRVEKAVQFLALAHQHNGAALSSGEGKALVRDFGSKLKAGIAVNTAAPSAASFYGSITNGIQIYSTPTLLIVTKTGKTLVLTGLQDAYSIEQAVEEARTS
jgi:hypothetical protein